jgi:hypothetical protein
MPLESQVSQTKMENEIGTYEQDGEQAMELRGSRTGRAFVLWNKIGRRSGNAPSQSASPMADTAGACFIVNLGRPITCLAMRGQPLTSRD